MNPDIWWNSLSDENKKIVMDFVNVLEEGIEKHKKPLHCKNEV